MSDGRKDVDQILKALKRHKIRYKRTRSSHYMIAVPPCKEKPRGEWITMPSTPGQGNRSMANTRAVIRRKLRITV